MEYEGSPSPMRPLQSGAGGRSGEDDLRWGCSGPCGCLVFLTQIKRALTREEAAHNQRAPDELAAGSLFFMRDEISDSVVRFETMVRTFPGGSNSPEAIAAMVSGRSSNPMVADTRRLKAKA